MTEDRVGWMDGDENQFPERPAAYDKSSEEGSVGRSGDSGGLLNDGLVTRPSSDSPAASS